MWYKHHRGRLGGPTFMRSGHVSPILQHVEGKASISLDCATGIIEMFADTIQIGHMCPDHANGSTKVIKHHHVREGYGGTFSTSALSLPIGTRTCITCIGVYFPISEERV